MTSRQFVRYLCPANGCGHQIALYVTPSETPYCSHVGTTCGRKPMAMTVIENEESETM